MVIEQSDGELPMSILDDAKSGAEVQAGAPLNGMSHVIGETDSELRRITIPHLFREAVAHHGARDAVVFAHTGTRLSYDELDRAIDALAAGLVALGLEKGDRIGIWSPNRLEWVLTQFATARIGLILVNINPGYRVMELDYALNKVGCKALVLARSFKTSDYLSMIRTLAPELDDCEPGQLVSEKLPTLKTVIVMDDAPVPGCFAFDAVKNCATPEHHARLAEIYAELLPDDAVNIQFTSGTTGSPKGATLSHFNIVNNARFVTDRIRLTEKDRLCIPGPLYHCFGMVMGVLGAVSKGAAMIFPGEAFESLATIRALADEKCTAVYGVPTMYVAMLEELENGNFDLSSMRTGIMSGAPCPIDIMKRVYAEMNMPQVTTAYGMTETSPVSFQCFVDDPTEKRCETVGRVHPHLEVKIVDGEGNTVPVGEKGELCTAGYSVMTGYWNDEERTAESIVDGWMHTGDLARFDEQGFCSIVGRVKDMIIRGGENIYPREIEEYLFTHPKISQVQVFGIPHEKYGEVVCAFVVAKPGSRITPEDVKDFCREQIAHFKLPKHVQIVDEITMTITGKPQKFVMRETMIDLLSGSDG